MSRNIQQLRDASIEEITLHDFFVAASLAGGNNARNAVDEADEVLRLRENVDPAEKGKY